jgi:hypothetical protein
VAKLFLSQHIPALIQVPNQQVEKIPLVHDPLLELPREQNHVRRFHEVAEPLAELEKLPAQLTVLVLSEMRMQNIADHPLVLEVFLDLANLVFFESEVNLFFLRVSRAVRHLHRLQNVARAVASVHKNLVEVVLNVERNSR